VAGGVGGFAQDVELAFPAGGFRGVVKGVGLAVGDIGQVELSRHRQLKGLWISFLFRVSEEFGCMLQEVGLE
jgi:hypothetical protein